ncbi:unnamed protein product [Peronospora destructor]|uniref:Uncharacterized protein n=1 Tax=Peronospora destructor TaxID=86335 RepID=A0AAV0VGY7_9STRA|nr:unnamed protein product [Peronospora destructor]
MKAQVVDIVLANLRYYVQLQLVDPVAELQRLYPRSPCTREEATAALYAHYAGTRNHTVAQALPKDFWGGSLLLRALAVYLRETVYVWDVAANGSAHAQQYHYLNHTMPNGDIHETGVVEPIPDERMRDLLSACYDHSVLPVMIALRHNEGHFYGISYGDTFYEWNILPGSEMRLRMDEVHAEMGLPILDKVHYSLMLTAQLEEAAILEELRNDVYASGSQECNFWTDEEGPSVTTKVPNSIHLEVYERILTTPDTDKSSIPDRRVASHTNGFSGMD